MALIVATFIEAIDYFREADIEWSQDGVGIAKEEEEKCQLLRIDFIEGKSEEYRAQLGEILYQSLVDVLNVPKGDRFQAIAEHRKSAGLTPEAEIRMRTSPDAGTGSGISSTTSTPRAGPCFSYHAAIIQDFEPFNKRISLLQSLGSTRFRYPFGECFNSRLGPRAISAQWWRRHNAASNSRECDGR